MDAWVVRAGKGGALAEMWYTDSYIAIYWNFGGKDISSLSKDELKELYPQYYPNPTARELTTNINLVYNFTHDLTEGITIIMPDRARHTYDIGKVIGPCEYDSNDHFHGDGAYHRKVIWEKKAPYGAGYSQKTLDTLKAHGTIFPLNDDAYKQLEQAARGEEIIRDNDEPLDREDRSQISDYIKELTPNDMEDLVAGLFKAMGYNAHITPRSNDGGCDVIAYYDDPGVEFDFAKQKIMAQVKRFKTSKVDIKTIHQFIGACVVGNFAGGVFVSTSGYTKDAKEVEKESAFPLKLLNMDEFIDLYIKYYDKTDDETRALLPLK